MKKLIAICLVALMCISVLAACTPAEPETPDVPGSTPEEDSGNEESSSTPTEGEGEYDVEAAKENVKVLNNNLLKNPSTGKDFTVTPQVMIAGVAYTVTWTVNTDKVTVDVNAEDNTVTINVDEDAVEDLEYVLTATITAPDGTTATLEFNLMVPKFKFTTFADYAAAEKGTFVTVQGIVTGVFSKTTGSQANGLYIQDMNNEGGYYVYNLTDDPNDVITPGMTVVVRGDKDLYNGTYEIINASVEVVDETIKTVAPIDYTNILTSAEKLSDAALVAKQALLVTIKGATILEAGDNGYYYFQLGAHKVYLRISSSNNATTSEALEAIKATHGANYGNVADVTGVISIYNGNFYLSPVSADAFSNITVPERTDAEKVALELSGLKLDASASSNKVIELPAVGTTYDNVTFTWATTDTTGAAVIADGKLTLTIPDETLVVTITVTATCGEASDSKEFTVKLSKSITPLKEAIEIGAAKEHNTYTEDKYIVAGIITEVYNETYGNMYIVDELGNKFTVYGVYIDGTKYGEYEGTKPVAGDYIVVIGALGQYNGTAQMKNADLVSFTTPTTITDAATIGAAKDHNTYTENKYIISGEITEVQSDKYGNVVIKDAEGNSILVYGLYSANGATRYDGMETKPAVGDTITVLGILGQYNGTAQMKNGWLVAHTVATGEGGEGGEGGDPVTGDVITTIAGALAGAEGAKVELTGTVVDTYSYGNNSVYIEDAEGNKILVYSPASASYIGDVITVTGTLGAYNGVNQVAAGATVVVTTAHTCAFSDATCTAPAICSVCHAINGTALGHDYGEGTACVRCGSAKPVEGATVVSKDDFATLTKSNSYSAEITTASGWKAVNAAVMVGGTADSNPVFTVFGSDDSTKAITINGKTTAVGKITSPTLSGGLSKITFKYTNCFGESNGVDITINIKQGDEIVATKQLDNDSVTKLTAYDFEWVLETVVTGEFVIEIVNNSPTSSTSNKDRVSIWNLEWTSAPVAG